MTPQERSLISQLFERLKSTASQERDPEAEAFIRSQVAAQPYAPYAMAQALIVQNQALESATARIRELEAQLGGRGREAGAERRGDPWTRPSDRAPGGYRPDDRAGYGAYEDRPMGAPAGMARGSVPPSGPWAGQQAGGPWQGQPGAQPQPYPQQPYPQQPSRAGSFLGGAMSTALGVAGGALLFGAVRDMFGGGSEAQAGEAKSAAADNSDAGSGGDNVREASDAGGGGEDGGWFSDLFGGGDEGGDLGGDDWA